MVVALAPVLASAQDTVEVQVEGDANTQVVFVEHDDSTAVVEEEVVPPPAAYPEAQANVQVHVPPPPQVQLQARNDRSLLRARLAEHPLGGPIAMTAAGIPIAAIFGVAAYYAYHVEDVVECISDDCSGDPNRTATAVLGTIAGVGLVLGVVGVIKLIARVGHRARIRAQHRRGELTFTGDGLRVAF